MMHAAARIGVVVASVFLFAVCGEKTNSAPPPAQPAQPAVPAAAKQPVGWRNDGSGRFPAAAPPLEWSDTRNILWTTRIGPNKYSSPIVVDEKVFLVADPASLFCVNAADGKVLWQRSNNFADLPEKVEAVAPRGSAAGAGNATPTPVSDGTFVYVAFGTGIVACYDMQGGRKWIHYFGLTCATEYGRATSPLLAGGKLLLTLNHLVAIDPATGNQLWENKDVPEMYGTPIAANVGGVDVAVMPSGQVVRAKDGAILAADLGGLNYASPIVHDGTVYLIQAGSTAQRLSPVAADKWEVKQAWDQELEGTFYASALWDNGLIYAVSNENKFNILDAADGKVLATRDLDFETANMYPSISLAGNALYVFNDRGDALVLEPGRRYQELKRNHLSQGHGGAPAFAGKRIFVRSGQNLCCIAEK